MRRAVAIMLSFLLLGTMLQPRLFAQETEGSGRKILTKITPVYPDLARRINLEGAVKLQVTVTPNGTAKNIEVVGGNPLLVRSAEDAVYKFRWAAAAQESKELIEIRFHR